LEGAKETIPIVVDAFYSGIIEGLTPILRGGKLVDQNEQRRFCSHSDNTLAYGEPDKVGFVVDIQLFHQVGFVRLHRPQAND